MLFLNCVAKKRAYFKNFRELNSRFCLTVKLVRLLLFFLVAGFFLFNTSTIEAQPQNPKEGAGLYEFGAGDVLEVLVFNEPEMSKTVFVRSDGRISLPLVGEFMAAGTTPEALAQKITETLMKVVEEPNVTVILTENNSKVYYVLGQIVTPGQYSITRSVTVLQAIARAGGFLEWAKKSRIMIVSGPQTSEKIVYFDYDDFLKGDNIEQNVVIKPEDTIVVP
ncbi:MAG: polysaccharide export protein [Desulfobacteraceae bacterium]|nr:polysaccharide biosynthesis/export family protein [Desulfobacteraceae bacterium]MBC2754791.1 polysaccharide export protein [Desulfobacteraceae bacterium]